MYIYIIHTYIHTNIHPIISPCVHKTRHQNFRYVKVSPHISYVKLDSSHKQEEHQQALCRVARWGCVNVAWKFRHVPEEAKFFFCFSLKKKPAGLEDLEDCCSLPSKLVIFRINKCWLVVGPPLRKILVRQLG